MKRKLIYFMIVVGLATAVTLKVSQNKVDMSELTLLNIEALADNETSSTIICFGEGEVICPLTGNRVCDYMIVYDLK